MPEKNPITPAMATIPHAGVTRDSNTNRMTIIIRDPALRLLFREFLQEIHCEENLTFYLEVKRFLVDYGVAKRSQPARLDLIRETLASAYSKKSTVSSLKMTTNVEQVFTMLSLLPVLHASSTSTTIFVMHLQDA